MSLPSSGHKAELLRLPLELRQMIYMLYLRMTDGSTLLQHYKNNRIDIAPSQPLLFGVSKQVYAELHDLLRHQRKFCYIISPFRGGFDYIARTCFRITESRVSFDEMQHLTIEIYPPHPESFSKFFTIWRLADLLIKDLSRVPVISSLSIHFMENDIALWSRPLDLQMEDEFRLRKSYPTARDFVRILNEFARLKNIRKCIVHLPPSLVDYQDMRDYAEIAQNLMTTSFSLAHNLIHLHYMVTG